VAYDVHFAGIVMAAIYFYGHLNFAFLENGWSRLKDIVKRKPRLRVRTVEDEPPAARDEIEADRLLDKIYREGQGSLTPREQQFLERYSRKVREKSNRG
jgi:hypothetical protein